MLRYRAAWVLPISSPPIRDGWVLIDDQRVKAVGSGAGDPAISERDLGSVALLPGLVNAHTHLELSYLRNTIPRASEFVTWIRGVMAARRERPNPNAPDILDGVDRGIQEAIAAGTAAIGDITNTLVTFQPLARSGLAGVVFHELIGFNPPDPEQLVRDASVDLGRGVGLLRKSVAAHAPYSVAPDVFDNIRRAVTSDGATASATPVPWSVHLAESREEVDFIKTGRGPWRDILEQLGVWNACWVPPEVSPVEYLDRAGWLDERLVTVHGVHMSSSDLARMSARGATLVTCPRSNQHTGAGIPPIEAFYRSGVRVAVGTDSLASTPDLNLFSELGEMRRLAPGVPASALLDSATRQGARALGLATVYGTIEPGMIARLVAVAVPAGTRDVGEYLVSGIHPEQVSWVE